jgi:hypothetical protein
MPVNGSPLLHIWGTGGSRLGWGAVRRVPEGPTASLSGNLDLWKKFIGELGTQEKRSHNIKLRKIQQDVCQNTLHQVFGSQSVDNAFFGLDFGSNTEGIFSATLLSYPYSWRKLRLAFQDPVRRRPNLKSVRRSV